VDSWDASQLVPRIQRSAVLAVVGSLFYPPFSQIAMRLSCQTPPRHPGRPSALRVHIGHALTALFIPSGNGSLLCQADQIPDWKSTISPAPKWLSLRQTRQTIAEACIPAPGPCIACRRNSSTTRPFHRPAQKPSPVSTVRRIYLVLAGRNLPSHRRHGYGGVSSAVAAMASGTKPPSM
jgi:hypothetical protein